jgi:nitroreductase/NAD-dependent dihydropyrimidine dehydrogenase PreA subunit
MSLINVDPEKCVACDHCVNECPVKIIERRPKHAVPMSRAAFKDWCIDCGHCVAVCPNCALSLHNLTPEQCLPVQEELLVDPESFEHFVRARRSIRTFKEQLVERESLVKLIDIARNAPTGSNRQTTRWIVVQSPEKVQEVSGQVIDWMRHMVTAKPDVATLMGMEIMIKRWDASIDVVCRNAPHLFIAHAPKYVGTPAADAHIALGILELAAFSFGLGGCWAGYVDSAINSWAPLKNSLGIPEGNMSFGVMMIGHPQYKYYRLPERHEAKVAWV